jgi:hypothetical protein
MALLLMNSTRIELQFVLFLTILEQIYQVASTTVKSLSFSLFFNGNTIGFRLPVNWQAIQSILFDIRRKNTKLERRIVEQEHAIDVGWRVIKDWVEAQLALIEANQVKIEQVFLPYAITSQGITLYEQIVSDPCLLLERNQS